MTCLVTRSTLLPLVVLVCPLLVPVCRLVVSVYPPVVLYVVLFIGDLSSTGKHGMYFFVYLLKFAKDTQQE